MNSRDELERQRQKCRYIAKRMGWIGMTKRRTITVMFAIGVIILSLATIGINTESVMVKNIVIITVSILTPVVWIMPPVCARFADNRREKLEKEFDVQYAEEHSA